MLKELTVAFLDSREHRSFESSICAPQHESPQYESRNYFFPNVKREQKDQEHRQSGLTRDIQFVFSLHKDQPPSRQTLLDKAYLWPDNIQSRRYQQMLNSAD